MADGWTDISVPIMPGIPVWPGDPEVEVSRRLSIDGGDDFNISVVTMSSHTGTHMDSPLHFIAGGAGLESMPLDATMGPARVIEISSRVCIDPDELVSHNIGPGQRLLFKTANSLRRWWEEPFTEDYVFLSLAGARFLAERAVACVGSDYLSIAGVGTDAAETHVTLLEAGVWIIEGLFLGGVEPGDHELACLPLPLQDADGAPVRAALRMGSYHFRSTGNTG